MKKLGLCILLCAIPLLAGAYPGAAQGSARYFPETQQTLNGPFLAYWEQHGGLMQQGYPISAELQEVSNLNGKAYTMQYCERAVFELHPENAPPYNVLLSLLGVFQYNKKYGANGTPPQHVNSDNPRFFPETGHSIGGRFRAYWEQHGGLAQQGYPISDEFQEQSEVDGKTYTVQYFQRAVFEAHPENQPPYDVLLSQLGRSRYAAKYGNPAPPSPTSVPASPRLLSKTALGVPTGTGHYVFWIDTRAANRPIYGYDLAHNQEFLITDRAGDKGELAADGNRLVWTESGPGNRGSIRGYDLAAEKEFPIIEAAGAEEFGSPSLDGDLLYYLDSSQGTPASRNGLYVRNLNTGQDQLISVTGRNPVAADGVLLWSEERQQSGRFAVAEWTLHLRKQSDPQRDSIIARDFGEFHGYHVSGDNVIWAASTPGNDKAHLYNISSGANQVVSAHAVVNPLISGNTVAWTEAPTGEIGKPPTWSIVIYNIATGAQSSIIAASATPVQAWALMEPPRLIYSLGNAPVMGVRELYAIELPTGTAR